MAQVRKNKKLTASRFTSFKRELSNLFYLVIALLFLLSIYSHDPNDPNFLNSGLSSDGSPAPSDIVFGGASYGEKSACEVAEFIMIASEISDADRHEIEGYLTHKWGLTANLPSDHPYKNIAP